jgi:DNA-binding CsgD family transcriptional regulator
MLAVVARFGAAEELHEFARAALDALADLIPYDVASFNEVDPTVPRIVEVTRPAGFHYPAGIHERWMDLSDEQPVLSHYLATGDGSATRISDVVDRSAFRATRLYREVYAPLGVELQMSCTLPCAAPVVVAIALSRTRRDFGDDERDLLDAVRPHLATHYAQARRRTLLRAALEDVVAASPLQALAVSDGSRLDPLGPRAEEMLERWLGTTGRRASLDRWLADERAGTASVTADAVRGGPLVLEDGAQRLSIRLVPGGRGPDLLVLDERPRHPAGIFASFGLPRRQADVLLLVVDGLDNTEIAVRLGITVATVRKHLERIYGRLGVHTRAGAVVAALALLRNAPK